MVRKYKVGTKLIYLNSERPIFIEITESEYLQDEYRVKLLRDNDICLLEIGFVEDPNCFREATPIELVLYSR